MKELWDDYKIKLIFTQTVSLSRELFKKFENRSDFLQSVKFVIVHSSAINPCRFSVSVLKGEISIQKP